MCSVITACGSLQGSSLLLEVQGRALRSLRCTSGTMVQTKFSQENDSSSILFQTSIGELSSIKVPKRLLIGSPQPRYSSREAMVLLPSRF